MARRRREVLGTAPSPRGDTPLPIIAELAQRAERHAGAVLCDVRERV